MSNRYYSFVKEGAAASIDIYGDITSWPWMESDVSSYNLSRQLDQLTDVDTINVNINSYGGEVAEGFAIYNALKRHSAKVVTRCDGFACSIASVIFAAGDERIMHDASLLMVHNVWQNASGNAAELRKQADELDVMTQRTRSAYLANVSISEEELTALMDGESWITPQDALDMGFATSIETFEGRNPSQSARHAAFERIAGKAQASNDGNPHQPAQSTDPAPTSQAQTDPAPAGPVAETPPPADPPADEAEQRIDAICSFFEKAIKR